jgi:cardiolipin synthase
VQKVSDRIVTIPNLLSFFRLLLIPVFLVLLVNAQYIWALVVLVGSSLTDFVDGYIARHFNQVTRVGQLLDPAADRLFIFSTLIGLAWTGFIPWWLAGVILARDLLLLILGVILANFGYGPLPVHHLGKMGTFALLTAMPLLVLGAAFPAIGGVTDPIGWAAALWGVFLYWWAGILYALEAGRLIRIPRDAPAAASDSLDVLRED